MRENFSRPKAEDRSRAVLTSGHFLRAKYLLTPFISPHFFTFSAHRSFPALAELADLSKSRAFVHRDVIGFVAFDHILRLLPGGVTGVSLELDWRCSAS